MNLELALTILPFVAILASIMLLLVGRLMYWKQKAKWLEQILEDAEIVYKKAIEIALKKEE